MQSDRSLPDSSSFCFSPTTEVVCVMLIIHMGEKSLNRLSPTTLHPTPLLGCPPRLLL